MLTVIAEIQIKEGSAHYETVLNAFRQVTPLVLQEIGCFGYELYIDQDSNASFQYKPCNSIIMFEKWQSLAHLEQHMQTPHMQEFQTLVKDAIQDTKIRIMQLGLNHN
ncbi:putative quinol monooxygenase [Acinetobacter zhairhuonensis]|uniref:putative quinol monooxygenase n=1 Tax=Acinetobacter sp. A7.4 TaxID=2919921 RepID=UPI001F4E65AB|nr:putative quinol monooxygenase [Acinetobacter sp. A7.4]MCJ8160058.1 antibiotic biosynthesis monooxygenase [Acinetobacter sp. A7.4]